MSERDRHERLFPGYRSLSMPGGPERRPPREPRMRRFRHEKPEGEDASRPGRREWIRIGVAAALGALVASFIVPGWPYRTIDALKEALETPPPKPTVRDLIVNDYVRQTRSGTWWAAKPTIFPQSVALMRKDFKQFDPRRPHKFRPAPIVYVPDAVHATPVFAGHHIALVGQIETSNVMTTPDRRGTEWLLQMRPLLEKEGLVYCRITLPTGERPDAGEYRVVNGVLLAAGTMSLVRGGFANGAYMACSGWRQPKGPIGVMLRTAHLLNIDIRSLWSRYGPKGMDAAFLEVVESKLPARIKQRLAGIVRRSHSREDAQRRVLRLLERLHASGDIGT